MGGHGFISSRRLGHDARPRIEVEQRFQSHTDDVMVVPWPRAERTSSEQSRRCTRSRIPVRPKWPVSGAGGLGGVEAVPIVGDGEAEVRVGEIARDGDLAGVGVLESVGHCFANKPHALRDDEAV